MQTFFCHESLGKVASLRPGAAEWACSLRLELRDDARGFAVAYQIEFPQ